MGWTDPPVLLNPEYISCHGRASKTKMILTTLLTDAPALLAAVAIISIVVIVYLFTRAPYARPGTKLSRLSLPPGPRPLPLLGNMLDMPRRREWETITKWSRTYGKVLSLWRMQLRVELTELGEYNIGDVVYVTVLGQHLVFVNSAKAAYDLFEKRSAIYSDRPRLPLLKELYVGCHHLIMHMCITVIILNSAY